MYVFKHSPPMTWLYSDNLSAIPINKIVKLGHTYWNSFLSVGLSLIVLFLGSISFPLHKYIHSINKECNTLPVLLILTYHVSLKEM